MLSTKMGISPRVVLSEGTQRLQRALEQAQRLQTGMAHAEAQKEACQARLAMTVDPAVFTESWLKYESLDAYAERMVDRREELQEELKAAMAALELVLPTAEQEQARQVEASQNPPHSERLRLASTESSARGAIKSAHEWLASARAFLDGALYNTRGKQGL